MEFEEVREYQPGEDIRSIDWNVTARTGRPFIKKFMEERELTIMLLFDMSGSTYFGSVNKLKRQLAAELCSLLALSAIKNNDKVGLIAFTDRIEKFVPPRKGLSHVLRIIREALYFEPEGKATDLSGALEYLGRVTNRSTVTFIISDFYDRDYKKPLSIAGTRFLTCGSDQPTIMCAERGPVLQKCQFVTDDSTPPGQPHQRVERVIRFVGKNQERT